MKAALGRSRGRRGRWLWWLGLGLCLLAAVLGGCAAGGRSSGGGAITVWADSGLQNRLEPMASRFAARDGVQVDFRFADTAALEQAVEAGEVPDLLIFSGEEPMKALYKAKAVDNYRLFVFRDDAARVYSVAKPMAGRNYRYAQRFAELVTGNGTESVSGSNPNL